ncbi:MAG: glycosyltransferase [Deltaproteobacteria bacterium]|nr:hypothetical protein AWN76_016130 [Rhodothermaceae bacterium RA]RMF45315.1 MAG: glycosyltransferase [Deltaproteobacteria bacterium]
MLPAYRVPVLERLNQRLQGRLVVCHGQPPHASTTLMDDIQSTFRREFIPNWWFRESETLHAQPFRHIFEQYGPPEVVLAEENPRSLTLPFLLRYARKQGAGRVLWGIFYSVFRPFSGLHPLQRYRIEMARRVEACACYTKGVRAALQPYLPDERLFVAQNTLEMDVLFRLRKQLEKEGKTAVRQRLQLPEEHDILVFVGQLIPRKGTQLLLESFAALRAERPMTLLIIGGGPEREPMEQWVRARNLPDVHFLGSIPRLEDSAPYLYAADVMVLPGYVGLVINHAFGMGLPLVTQHPPGNIPFHGPEIESLEHGYNGFMVQRGNFNAFLNAIRLTLKKRTILSRNAITYAEQHLTVDHMLDGLVGAISYAAAHRPRS